MDRIKFTLFEIEKISVEELLREFPPEDESPESRGYNDNQVRANVAMRMMDEGRLSECPLMTDDRELFLELLIMTRDEIREMTRKINNTSGFAVSSLLTNYTKHRILCIYMTYSTIVRIGSDIKRNDDINEKYLFEYSPYLDESYYKAIRDLSDDDLKEFYYDLEAYSMWTGHDIKMEDARRNYGINISIPRVPYMKKIAIDREDDKMMRKLDLFMRAYHSRDYNIFMFLVIPNVENAKRCLGQGSLGVKDMIYSLLSAVNGTSPHTSQIEYENYIGIMKYLMSTKGVNCEELMKDIGKEVKTDSMKRIVVATMIRICGGSIGEFVSKGMSMKYIPEGYYQ